MPLSTKVDILAGGLVPLFDPRQIPPVEASDPIVKALSNTAEVWASAIERWMVAGGIPAVSAKKAALKAALIVAFNPFGGGAAPALIGQAFSVFWIGTSVPAQSGVVAIFLPTPFIPLLPPLPLGATPQQQAQLLAQTIYLYTVANASVQPPPPPGTPLL